MRRACHPHDLPLKPTTPNHEKNKPQSRDFYKTLNPVKVMRNKTGQRNSEEPKQTQRQNGVWALDQTLNRKRTLGKFIFCLFFFFFLVLKVKSRTFPMLGKPSTTELNPQPWEI
jgi:hypothetical protein